MFCFGDATTNSRRGLHHFEKVRFRISQVDYLDIVSGDDLCNSVADQRNDELDSVCIDAEASPGSANIIL